LQCKDGAGCRKNKKIFETRFFEPLCNPAHACIQFKTTIMRQLFTIAFLLLFTCYGNAQTITITGRITDQQGSPLAGASIVIKGTKTGVASDANGVFSLQLPVCCKILVVSYIGYEIKEVQVKDSDKNLLIALEPRALEMDGCVVVGYGSARKQMKMTGSIVRIHGDYIGPVRKNSESYKEIVENNFKKAGCEPISTLSADVDKAAYGNVRRFLTGNALPETDAVRVEEMINYFDYQYPEPTGKHPYALYSELTQCPWNKENKLLLVAMQAKKPVSTEAIPNNLVFLIDVSGSMQDTDKLPLLKASFQLLLDSLQPNDLVSIVTYAGASGLALPATPVRNKKDILNALDRLKAGGSTAGGEGIELAYQTAVDNFIEGGNNRVILATDGDFNVGLSTDKELQALIEEKRNAQVYLTCLGFGEGNYKDDIMETLADKGNGNYYYIDNINEARKVLQKDFRSTLYTIAKDVKMQVAFNSRLVQSWRLIGYENRLLDTEDFDNDAKDAGEMGEGHTVTVLYEIVPRSATRAAEAMVGDSCTRNPFNEESGDLAMIQTRYKLPMGFRSRVFNHVIADRPVVFEKASENTRFAASVALFGMLLRQSSYSGMASYDDVLKIASRACGTDVSKQEMMQLVIAAAKLDDREKKETAGLHR
jgi:Ca-activated chloride channel homolog